MTPDDLRNLRELRAKATPLPWRVHRDSNRGIGADCTKYNIGGFEFDSDDDFAVAAVNALPALLDLVDSLTKERDEAGQAFGRMSRQEEYVVQLGRKAEAERDTALRERDEARAERDAWQERAEDGALDDLERIAKLETERDAVRAELERARPVVEAALEWRMADATLADPDVVDRTHRVVEALTVAVDAYRAATKETP